MFKPLKGIKVLDMTGVLAGPYSTYQLGLLGAEKIDVTSKFISKTGESSDLRKATYEESIGWYEGITSDMFS